MNPTQALIAYFQTYLTLTDEEQQLIATRATHRKIKRRQMILQEGFACKHYSFVVEGCFKMYSMDRKGTEHNIQFAAENDWIADIGSFHSKKPSQLFIEATKSSAYRLTAATHASVPKL